MKTMKVFVAVLIAIMLIAGCAPKGPSGRLVFLNYDIDNNRSVATLSLENPDSEIVPLAGGEDDAIGPYVSPNGSEYVFVKSDKDGIVATVYKGTSEIHYSVDAPLPCPDNNTWISWKETGKFLLFACYQDNRSSMYGYITDLVVYEFKGNELEILSKYSGFSEQMSPATVSPDGTKVLSYTYDEYEDYYPSGVVIDSQDDITKIAVLDDNLKPPTETSDEYGYIENVAWGKYGILIQTTVQKAGEETEERCINIYNPNTGQITKNVVCSRGSSILAGSYMRLSPDGKKLAFYTNYYSPTQFAELIVLDVKSQKVLFQTTSLVIATQVYWSPDGRYIAYWGASPDRNDTSAYYFAIPADGSSEPLMIRDVNTIYDGYAYLVGWLR
jgi:hypothetical protein